ncbi:PEP-CTERM sorting domain-containing protein [Massilia cellulosiltytica]|uniref:PEP-CTERM sorting domain-containing protein n=1 Tax=Massilia cellulosiltytica TaxID=2683234 RepID=UPI0013659C40|nr:PEP-CTERM sorting domain-containing protein [Telluria cellulosilytica]
MGDNSWVIDTDREGLFSGYFAEQGPVTVSGNNYAWNNGAQQLAITSSNLASSFDFLSVWIRQGYPKWTANSPPAPITFTGFSFDREMYSFQFSPSANYQFLQLNFRGINRLVIDNNGNEVLLDDLKVELPEPSTSALFMIGLIAVLSLSRKSGKA